MHEVAYAINLVLLEPLGEYQLPSAISKLAFEAEHASEFLVVSGQEVYMTLSHLNSGKAGGPDWISNWILKDNVDFLAYPVTTILNASFKEQRLPNIWNLVGVSRLPKMKPLKELKKDFKPISLARCISKVVEEFVVTEYVKPAALRGRSYWDRSNFNRSEIDLTLISDQFWLRSITDRSIKLVWTAPTCTLSQSVWCRIKVLYKLSLTQDASRLVLRDWWQWLYYTNSPVWL